MRKLLLVLAGTVALLALAGPVSAATVEIRIRAGGFAPNTVGITAGDTVIWVNADTRNRQVVADRGGFVSPILRPGQNFSFVFATGGRYTYHEGINSRLQGTIVVKEPPPSLTIASSASLADYGAQVTLSGAVSSKREGEQVTLYYRPYPQTSFLQRTVVITTAGGAWAFVAQPQVLTSYQASFRGVMTPEVVVEVKPKVSFGRNNGFVVKVKGGRSFAGRAVQFQRLSSLGQWVTLKKVVLGEGSTARFRHPLVKGRHSLRIAMSVNQAGAGYLAAFSQTLVYTR